MERHRAMHDRYTGPVVATRRQVVGAGELATAVFRSGEGHMVLEYPLLFRASPDSRVHVILHKRRVVAMVGLVVYDATLDGCRTYGGRMSPRCFPGSVKLLDAARLWRDFRPLVVRRAGTTVARRMCVESESHGETIDALRFTLGEESVRIEGSGPLTAALFGHPTANPLGRWSKRLGSLLDHALPLPLPGYGLKYV